MVCLYYISYRADQSVMNVLNFNQSSLGIQIEENIKIWPYKIQKS